VTPPTGADIVTWMGRASLWLWLVQSAAFLAVGIFFGETTPGLRPVALSFGSALLTRWLLGRIEIRRGEGLLIIIPAVGIHVAPPPPVLASAGWPLGLAIGGGALMALALATHVVYLRARRVLAEASAA
jgi:hypothetical protein